MNEELAMGMPINEIEVGERHRQDMGDLKALAGSIEEQGLLQPIGITEDRQLVFGARRLRACKDILGWTEISVRVVNVKSIVEGELHENVVRKDFTPSERVAIAETIRAQLGDRQGQRTDRQTLPQNIADVSRGTETREIAAKQAGFGNRTTYEQAKAVIETAEPEVVAAMDRGDLSISAAAQVAKQPSKKQRHIAGVSEKDKREARQMVRDMKNPEPMSDGEQALDDVQEVLMAIETLADPPRSAERLVAAMFTGQEQGWVELLRKAQAYLTALEKEISSHDKNSTEQVA